MTGGEERGWDGRREEGQWVWAAGMCVVTGSIAGGFGTEWRPRVFPLGHFVEFYIGELKNLTLLLGLGSVDSAVGGS